MTKKDYMAIAAILKSRRDSLMASTGRVRPEDVIDGITDQMALMMQRDNPRFDRERFLAACGFGE